MSSLPISELLRKPNKVDPWDLPFLVLMLKRDLPRQPAIYFVITTDKLLYIGSTINLWNRWNANVHHVWDVIKTLNEYVAIAYMRFNSSQIRQMRNLEIALIRSFQPELNQIYRDNRSDSVIALSTDKRKMPRVKGVPADRDEIKTRHNVMVSPSGWAGLGVIAKRLGYKSRSDLLDAIGREEVEIIRLDHPAESHEE
ncbi:MAG: GIY-YIG nuclease family protein [Leptolyngbya sp. UWPOB_LEPTO1]|uniref:GIY-YIG nuclease family protein n=1 Tax=Leptolyngbya sp. UWPOB_LEPTO1 TaxID=2815653 RepID=UPI001AD3A44B|nr:GIY-YIG nuclease family protein [Leptolyngbya sp. UWPOB_LEPTO1]MBN8561070.1 GIY-YIG nuclease family protein [Leptolyngbya sp. UWPOB_LEPTO1]